MAHSPRWLPASLLLGPLWGVLWVAPPARAGLMRPVLDLMRPQMEQRITTICLERAANGQAGLRQQLEQPCRQLARTTSRCLVEETDASGKTMAVMGELLRQQLGPEGERIAKRCLARLVGLPPASLEAIPLRQLTDAFTGGRR
jgi:hypothetical protein